MANDKKETNWKVKSGVLDIWIEDLFRENSCYSQDIIKKRVQKFERKNLPKN